MDLTPLYERVIGPDVHQAKITACAIAGDLMDSVYELNPIKPLLARDAHLTGDTVRTVAVAEARFGLAGAVTRSHARGAPRAVRPGRGVPAAGPGVVR